MAWTDEIGTCYIQKVKGRPYCDIILFFKNPFLAIIEHHNSETEEEIVSIFLIRWNTEWVTLTGCPPWNCADCLDFSHFRICIFFAATSIFEALWSTISSLIFFFILSPGGALTPAASDNRFNEPVRGCLQYSLQYTVWQTLLLRSAHATGLCSQGNFHYRGKVVHVAQTLVMYGSQTLPQKKKFDMVKI